MKYLNEAADENNLREKIQFSTKVKTAKWDSVSANWTLEVEKLNHQLETVTCKILIFVVGTTTTIRYLPEFDGYEDFQGTLVHPQKWPENLDYNNKRVVVIGSGDDRKL